MTFAPYSIFYNSFLFFNFIVLKEYMTYMEKAKGFLQAESLVSVCPANEQLQVTFVNYANGMYLVSGYPLEDRRVMLPMVFECSIKVFPTFFSLK